jgi:hypothetical protein
LSILTPGFYHVFYRNPDGRWGRVWRDTSIRVNSHPELPLNQADWDLEKLYGITEAEIHIALFRINGGKAGYYLVHPGERKYYYCGLESASIFDKFRELGFGAESPIDAED